MEEEDNSQLDFLQYLDNGNDTIQNDYEEEEELDMLNKVPLVKKEEWGGMNPSEKERESMRHLMLPVESVVLAYNTGMLPRTTKTECIQAMQDLQLRHMENGEPDICYNFMICGDGNVYEGRGWDWGHSDRLTYPEEYGDTLAIGMFGDISPQESEADGKDEERPIIYRKKPVGQLLAYALEAEKIVSAELVYNDYDHKVLGENEFYTHEDRPLSSDLSEPDDKEVAAAEALSDYSDTSGDDDEDDADDEDEDDDEGSTQELVTDDEQEKDDEEDDLENDDELTKEEEEQFLKLISYDPNKLGSDDLVSGYDSMCSFSSYHPDESEVKKKESHKGKGGNVSKKGKSKN